jgi:ComF family protein
MQELHPLPLSAEQSLLQLASLHCVSDATMMYVAFEYEEDGVLEQCIHALKYRRMHSVGHWLGRLLAERLLDSPLCEGSPVLVPIPLHRVRQIERGYNQAACICDGFSRESGLATLPGLLQRPLYTRSQSASQLNRDQRMKNVKDAFRVDRRALSTLAGRPVILLDDVITTGATMSACVSVLNRHAVHDVRMLAVARPPRH